MKKLFALALVVLGLAACQTDHSDLDVQFDGNATITLSIPADAVTRAGDSNSAWSGLENTEGETLRFILEIYDEYGDKKIRETKYAEQDILTANFPVRLVPGRKYTLVAWADMVTKDENNNYVDNHYITSNGLTEITLNGNWDAMDETRDAFTASKTITAYSSTENLNMQLTRPFAKLRVIATDVAALKELGLEAKKVTIAFNGKVANSYNAFNQEVASTATRDEFTFDIAEYGDSKDGKLVLYTDYIFANEEQGAVKFSLTTLEESGREIKTVNFNTDIPVKRNMLTTLTGNVMTEGNNVSVEVNPVFPVEGGKHDITAISSYQDLLTAIDEGGEYLVINDITVNAGAGTHSLAATRTGEAAAEESTPVTTGKTTTINLNGFTITVNNNSATAAITIPAGDTLVIAGNGSIELTEGSTGAVFNNDEGKVIIAGGEFENNATDTNASIFTKEENVTDYVAELKDAFANRSEYKLLTDVTLNETLTLAAGNTLTLDLNGKTLAGMSSTTGKNYDFIDVRGTLNVENGTITAIFKGENMGWNNSTNVFNITAGGVVNLNGVTATNLGGSDMAFVAHLNNWGEVTLNVENSTLESNYVAVRVFNSGPNMNNVTIQNSTLKGGNYAFWVHNYTMADFGSNEKAEKQKELLNFDIFNGTNTFIGKNSTPIRYGFNEPFYLDANGNRTIADGVAISLAGDYYISNAVGLKWVAENVNTMEYYVNASANIFDGKTVYLANDIDLGGDEWRPIGDYAFSRTSFNGVFDGQNYKVSNFKVTNKVAWSEKVTEASYGFFGNVKGTIKNLIIENATINPDGGRYSAALVGRLHNGGAIENCHVVNSAVTISHWQVGGIVGQNNNGNIYDSSVTNSTITGMAAVGAIVGMDMVAGEHQITNCQVKNTHLVQNSSFGESYDASYGLIVGLANKSGIILNLNDITVENNTIKGETSDTLVGDMVDGVVIKIDGKSAEEIAFAETLAEGGNVTLSTDMTLNAAIELENTVVTLDLNGKTITAPKSSAFVAKAGAELTIKNGKVVAYESTVRAIGGKATIESGEYTSTGTALDSPATYRYSLDCREGGELIINGGTFKSNNGMINVSSTVTINGGQFENIVEKSMTRHFAYVSAALTINDGEFYGKANSSAGGCFFCGAAAGCDIQITGGKFTSLWTSGSVNRIFELYTAGGKIEVTGGLFNTNGGISAFVTENTDEATKVEYPYVAK